MAGGYQVPRDGEAGLKAKFESLQRQIDELRGSAPSNSTTIVDADGNPQVHLGALADGGYGIEQIVNGNWVPLAALAGGAVAESGTGDFNLSVSGGSSGTWTDGDAPVDFTSHTGKYLLLLVAGSTSISNANAGMGYRVSGAQTVAVSNSRSAFAFSTGLTAQSQVYAELRTGTPGDMTLTPMFICSGTGSGTASVVWQTRTTIVLPF